MRYQIWYSYISTLEKSKNCTLVVCTAFLKDEVKTNKEYLYIKLNNTWAHKDLTSQEWIDLCLTDLSEYFVKVEVEETFVHLWFDTSKLNYSQVVSVVSLARYLGEHTEYITNYLNVKEQYPNMTFWDAVYCAHKLGGGNFNHTIIRPGIFEGCADEFSIDAVKQRLNATEHFASAIHYSWFSGEFNPSCYLSDLPKLFTNPYFLEKEAA
jgi:hypothetical protein